MKTRRVAAFAAATILAAAPQVTAQEMPQGAYTCFRVDTAQNRHPAIGLYVEPVLDDVLAQLEVEAGPEAEVCFATQSEAGGVRDTRPVLVCLDVVVFNPDPMNENILLEAQTVFGQLDGQAYEPTRLCFAAEADARSTGGG